MTENTALWDKLGKTDPAHTKPFKRAGGFTGTAIKPMWSYRRMTEEFGPCGKGWGVNEPSFQVVPTGDTVLVFCTASVWYESHDQIVFGVGGDMAAGKRGQHSMVDDEAFKKAFTDAVTNALKLIGVGADVHMGMFDDNKYVNTMKQEFADDHKAADNPKPTSAAATKRHLATIDQELIDCRTPNDVKKLLNAWADTAEIEKWSNDYWDEARRRFARRKAELERADDPVEAIQEQFPGSTVTDERITDVSGRELELMEG